MRSYLLLRRVVAGYVERLEGMGVCVPCRLAFRDMAMRAIRKNHDGEMQLQDAYGEMMRAYYIATSCSFRIEERSRRDETE